VTRTVAAFDFDGTLTDRDTLLPFLASVVGWPRVATALGMHAHRLARNRDVAKELVLARLLAGLPDEEVREAGRVYARRVRVRPEMRARLLWHRQEGHDIVIASASLDVYLGEVARSLDVEHVLCTTLEVGADARCTGRLVGGNCRGPEKATRLRAHLGDETDGEIVLWAYGDSRGDLEMLAMADHPIRVKRGRLPRRV
jgi:HAD superfamily hydrolase (TIGR01490 family)